MTEATADRYESLMTASDRRPSFLAKLYLYSALFVVAAIVVIPQRFERTTTPVPTQEVSA